MEQEVVGMTFLCTPWQVRLLSSMYAVLGDSTENVDECHPCLGDIAALCFELRDFVQKHLPDLDAVGELDMDKPGSWILGALAKLER